jgi:glycosyltransferase involved in cell wall biosynthesis
MMRLLFVIDHLGVGGAQRQLGNLAAGMARRGHDVDVFCYFVREHFTESVRSAGVRLLAEEKPSRYSIEPVKRLCRTMRQGRYDIALSYLPVPNLYAILAGLWTTHRPAIVVSERGTAPQGRGSLVRRVIERFYPSADHLVVNSYHLAAHYRHRYRKLASRVTTIWNSVDIEAFSFTPSPPVVDELRLLALGNMRQSKNWLCLVEALAVLRDRYKRRPHVDYAGRLTELNAIDTKYLEDVRALLAKHRLEAHWTWLGPQSDVAALLRSHHLLVHPSYVEGLPNVVCESLACGRPVILSDTLDHPRLVRDGETGFLFDWRSPEQLAAVLDRAAALSDVERDRMGRAGRAFAENHFTLARVSQEYEELFERVLAERRLRCRSRAIA